MLGLTFDKLLILIVIAAFILGPKRLPAAASALGRWVRKLKAISESAATKLGEESGVGEIDWKQLDPRQYDPRRIIREALIDPPPSLRNSDSARPADLGLNPLEGSKSDASRNIVPPHER